LFNFGNSLGDLDPTRAGIGAVEGGPASPYAFFRVENFKAASGAGVTTIKNEAVRSNNGLWPKVLVICPKHWAASCAGCAQDAFSTVVKARAIFLRLDAFTLWFGSTWH
jgi:hypothetical protein